MTGQTSYSRLYISNQNLNLTIDSSNRPLKGNWSGKEDDYIRNFVEKHGFKNISGCKLPNRSLKSIKDRWHNTLKPHISKEPWTIEEDYLLMRLYLRLGPKWKILSSIFRNRGGLDIKNRFYSTIRKESRRLKYRLDDDSQIRSFVMLIYEDKKENFMGKYNLNDHTLEEYIKLKFQNVMTSEAKEIDFTFKDSENSSLRSPRLGSEDVKFLERKRSNTSYENGINSQNIQKIPKETNLADLSIKELYTRINNFDPNNRNATSTNIISIIENKVKTILSEDSNEENQASSQLLSKLEKLEEYIRNTKEMLRIYNPNES